MTPEFLLFGLSLDDGIVRLAKTLAENDGFDADMPRILAEPIAVKGRRFARGIALPAWAGYFSAAAEALGLSVSA